MTTVSRAGAEMRPLVSCVCMAIAVVGVFCAEMAAARSPQPERQSLRLSRPGEAVTIAVAVAGAVKQPGSVVVSPLAATIDNVLGAAGGVMPDGYRFAAILLRETTAAAATPEATSGRCVPVTDLHAALLLRDDPVLSLRRDLADQLLAGRLRRAGVQELAVATEGPSTAPNVLNGDILALPARTGTVYVAPSAGRILAFQHEPTARAEEYLRKADPDESSDVDRYVLMYPSGRSVSLQLEAWHYEPTMVPPGSLIAPAIDCLPSA